MRALWSFLARHRRWTWLAFAINCDVKMRRRGDRCFGWREHRPKDNGGVM